MVPRPFVHSYFHAKRETFGAWHTFCFKKRRKKEFDFLGARCHYSRMDNIINNDDMLAAAGEWQEQREILAAEALREDEQAEGWRLLGVTLFEE